MIARETTISRPDSNTQSTAYYIEFLHMPMIEWLSLFACTKFSTSWIIRNISTSGNRLKFRVKSSKNRWPVDSVAGANELHGATRKPRHATCVQIRKLKSRFQYCVSFTLRIGSYDYSMVYWEKTQLPSSLLEKKILHHLHVPLEVAQMHNCYIFQKVFKMTP